MSYAAQNLLSAASCEPKARTLWQKLTAMSQLARQRRQLKALDAHLLRDIGVTRSEALAECKKLTWHAPDHWVR